MVQRVAGSNPAWASGTITFTFTINQTTVHHIYVFGPHVDFLAHLNTCINFLVSVLMFNSLFVFMLSQCLFLIPMFPVMIN